MSQDILQALAGGALIGSAAAFLLLLGRETAGISSIAFRAAGPRIAPWSAAFLAGLVLAGVISHLVWGVGASARFLDQGWTGLVLAGLLVGVGTRLGNGCTSGHGVCGLANLSLRSLSSVAVFMGTAAAVVFVLRHTPLSAIAGGLR